MDIKVFLTVILRVEDNSVDIATTLRVDRKIVVRFPTGATDHPDRLLNLPSVLSKGYQGKATGT
jgi:hypothetical protein